ncbi:adenylate cyclase [Panacagrimonas perspica]|uniref:Adenylate cyclase n=1 Tax=Panacagrimonas perspica TaxID=381431 RepID=A0A4S3JZJ1_9GAMM|nr:adenylate/guanylate cyclase domain-containing protein [Panacagrimonas perspica]TDU32903.1 adenylate cyclase [Panacagrimonas perspica]THD01010.1 hypothetical protein B1810_22435 [Panacagrimonas perspica]
MRGLGLGLGAKHKVRRWAIRLGLGLFVFALFVLHSAGYAPMGLLTQIEAWTYDERIRLTLQNTVDDKVVILDMDDRTLAAEGWPLPRDRLAELLDLLFDRYHIRALGSDILFSEPDRSSGAALLERLAAEELADLPGFAKRVAVLAPQFDNDRRFAEALKGRAVVLAYFFKPALMPGDTPISGALCAPLVKDNAAALYAVDFASALGFTGNLPGLQGATPHCGYFDNPLLDADGVFRRVPLVQKYAGALYPSLALALTRLSLGNPPVELQFSPPDVRTSLNIENLVVGDLVVPVDGTVAALVPYRGRFGSFRYLSVTDVLHGRVDETLLRDRIVLLGTSAAGLFDLRSTPVGQNYAGVEVHANLVSGMLEGRIKRKAPYYNGIEVSVLLVIVLVVGLAFPRLSPLAGAGLAVGVIAAVIALAMWMWTASNFVMPLGVPVVFTLVLLMGHLLVGYLFESRRARDTQLKFGQYVPPEVVEEMSASGQAISMEGESREMSVLFTDVRGFTDISEKMEVRDLSALMNAFLTRQTEVIQRHRGTIDKYMGDAIMAFWGAPMTDEQHAQRALEAGMELVRAVRGLDDAFARRGWPPLYVGVGVNTGKMHVGNMGSEFRVAYTVIGDAVNLGSRVESLTKEYGVSILCTEWTRAAAPQDWSFREVDFVRVKGRAEPVGIYEPLGPKEALDPALRHDLARHRGAMILYRRQRWDEAEAELLDLSRSERPHRIYELFIERIRELRSKPPGPAWDGVYTFHHK